MKTTKDTLHPSESTNKGVVVCKGYVNCMQAVYVLLVTPSIYTPHANVYVFLLPD